MPAKTEKIRSAIGLKYRYHPFGAAHDVFESQAEEILLAGPKGTGKSLAILQKIHLMMSKHPMAKGFMSRKTRSSMTNSCIDMFERHVLKPADRVRFQKTDQQFQYPNGSLIATVGLDEPMRLQSSEWDVGYIQEATECTEHDWEMCTGLLRNGVISYQQLLGDCNPDKPTHWLKKRCDQEKTLMMRSYHEDNPRFYDHGKKRWTPEGVKYRGKLDRLSGHRRGRLYLGLWVAAEGMVYEKWDPEIHMISFSEMPKGWEEWPHYWSIDWGHVHPFVWQDWVENPDTGAMYRVKEIYQTGWLVEDSAKYIKKLVDGRYIPRAIICDHDLEDRKVFERYTQLLTLPAYKPIQPGIQGVQSRLDPNWRGTGKPGFFLVRDALDHVDAELKDAGHPTCTEEEIDGYVWDENHNRLVNSKKDELPLDKDNHGMDSSRYMVAFLDDLAEDPEEFEGVISLADENEVIISPY